MAEAQSVLIAGTWRPANAEGTFQPDNPTTKEKTGEVYPVSTVEDVEEAVKRRRWLPSRSLRLAMKS